MLYPFIIMLLYAGEGFRLPFEGGLKAAPTPVFPLADNLVAVGTVHVGEGFSLPILALVLPFIKDQRSIACN